jgi:hypothetical protein
MSRTLQGKFAGQTLPSAHRLLKRSLVRKAPESGIAPVFEDMEYAGSTVLSLSATFTGKRRQAAAPPERRLYLEKPPEQALNRRPARIS